MLDYDTDYRGVARAVGHLSEAVATLPPAALPRAFVGALQHADEPVVMSVVAEVARRLGAAPTSAWAAIATEMDGEGAGARQVFGHTLHRLMVRRVDGVIVYMSPLTRQSLGFDQGVPEGTTLNAALPALGPSIPPVNPLTLAGRLTRDERWYDTRHGRWHYTTYTAPIRAGGLVVGVLSLYADTTPPGASSREVDATRV